MPTTVERTIEFTVTEFLTPTATVYPDLYLIGFDVSMTPVIADTKTIEFNVLEEFTVTKLIEFAVVNQGVADTKTIAFNIMQASERVLGTIDFNVICNPYRAFIYFSAGSPVKSLLSVTFYVNEQHLSIGVPMTSREVTGGTLAAGRKTVTVKVHQNDVLVCTADSYLIVVNANAGIWVDITGIPLIYAGNMVVTAYVKGVLTYTATLPYSASLGVKIA